MGIFHEDFQENWPLKQHCTVVYGNHTYIMQAFHNPYNIKEYNARLLLCQFLLPNNVVLEIDQIRRTRVKIMWAKGIQH